MIKFRSLRELEHILFLENKKDRVFILPLNRDGRLGLPILYDEGFRGYVQLDKFGREGELFSPIEKLPDEGWILIGHCDIPFYEGSKRRYKIDTVSVSSGSKTFISRIKNRPENNELDKFIFSLNPEGEFKLNDTNVVKVIQAASELEANLIIGWFDSKVPACLWLTEEDV